MATQLSELQFLNSIEIKPPSLSDDLQTISVYMLEDQKKLLDMPDSVYEAIKRTAILVGISPDEFALVDYCRESSAVMQDERDYQNNRYNGVPV